MQSSGDILDLVRDALDGFDERPLSANVRKTIRIANLLGESTLAVRLSLELKPTGGNPPSNAADIKRLLTDDEDWGRPDGVVSVAVDEYTAERTIKQDIAGASQRLSGQVLAHSLEELDFWDQVLAGDAEQYPEGLTMKVAGEQTRVRVRHRCFVALCQWERSLTYTDINERIFNRLQSEVDQLLERLAPDVLAKFGAVYRRLREASQSDANMSDEELSQALGTCRRILEAVADHVWPQSRPATLRDGSPATGTQYRARISQFLRDAGGESYGRLIEAEIAGLYGRFEAADKLASKGVHANVALREAEAAAIFTYIIAGNLLRLAQEDHRGAEDSTVTAPE